MALVLLSGCADKEKTVKDICIEVGEEYFEYKLNKYELTWQDYHFSKTYDIKETNGIDPFVLGKKFSARLLLRLTEVFGTNPVVYTDKYEGKFYSWHKDGFLITLQHVDFDYGGEKFSHIELKYQKY